MLNNGDMVRFFTGAQSSESPLPANAWVEGSVYDAAACRLYPSNPTVATKYGMIVVLRTKLQAA
jgi:hypothetical protein